MYSIKTQNGRKELMIPENSQWVIDSHRNRCHNLFNCLFIAFVYKQAAV